MRLGITDFVDCAHLLPGHPKCGQLHGHTYRVEIMVEGEADSGGMVVDFADLRARVRAVLDDYDHRHWNDVLEYPTVENICELLARRLEELLGFSFVIRVWEGNGKWNLLGYGSEGSNFGTDWKCTVLDRDDYVDSPEDLIGWASHGHTETMTLSCEHAGKSVSGVFAVSHISCFLGGPDYIYSAAYNQELLSLRPVDATHAGLDRPEGP